MSKETNIEAAIAFANLHPKRSERSVAKLFAIARSTFRQRRERYILPRQIAHESQQRLTIDQEKWLSNWVIKEDKKGMAPSYQKVRQMATSICLAGGDTKPLGKNWIFSFKMRNPSISTLVGRKVDAKRVHGANESVLQEYFKLLDHILIKYSIKTEDIYNMDEHGTLIGASTNSKVLGNASFAKSGVTIKKHSENREWVTVLECASPVGRPVPPLVIFKGKYPQTTWFPLDLDSVNIEGWKFACSKNGWTSDEIALEWLKEVFLPSTKPQFPRHWRLLIVDGHGSHASELFMHEAWNNKVQVLYLPAHTSHVTQPLDLAVFGPLKTCYCQQVEHLSCLSNYSMIKKQSFVELYAKACDEAFTLQNQRSGFCAAGIVPFQPQIVLDSLLIKESVATKNTEKESTVFKEKIMPVDLIGLSERGARLKVHSIYSLIGNKNLEIACLQQEIAIYKQKYADAKAIKKKRILPMPNCKFADRKAIMRAVASIKAKKSERRCQKRSLGNLNAGLGLVTGSVIP